MCEKFNAQHVPYADFTKNVNEYDCVICATSSKNYILSPEHLLDNGENRDRPLQVIDLGAPRNVDPAITAIKGVSLVCVDDLRATADRHLKEREHEIGDIENIIEEQVAEFTRWYQYRSECECSQKSFRNTRSKLALAQADIVAGKIKNLDPSIQVEIVVITTTGDKDQKTSLKEIGGKEFLSEKSNRPCSPAKLTLQFTVFKDITVQTADGCI
jgi:glutamyl-tRNA reductase